MSVFQEYSRYYDLLYQGKDYAGEARYVHGLLRSLSPGATTLLELGCGTGGHALPLSGLGWRVTGVDLSDESLRAARDKQSACPEAWAGVRLVRGDIREARLGQRFDAAAALFHVLCYQTTADDLARTLTTVREHLAPGGVFLFDFWHGPGVLSDPPKVAVRHLENDRLRLTRLAEPTVRAERNVVDVRYTLFDQDKATGAIRRLEETHAMRYFFELELRELLARFGFRPAFCLRWMTDQRPERDTWFAVMGAVLEK
ncbi:class I SAM-dependent methyltransferase [Fundidesulfovibrio butyratiphilus]